MVVLSGERGSHISAHLDDQHTSLVSGLHSLYTITTWVIPCQHKKKVKMKPVGESQNGDKSAINRVIHQVIWVKDCCQGWQSGHLVSILNGQVTADVLYATWNVPSSIGVKGGKKNILMCHHGLCKLIFKCCKDILHFYLWMSQDQDTVNRWRWQL